jgi:hypothetical protein
MVNNTRLLKIKNNKNMKDMKDMIKMIVNLNPKYNKREELEKI